MWTIKAHGGLDPEEARGRHLNPLQRRQYVDLMSVVTTWEECVPASEQARAKLYRMQARYDEATQPQSGFTAATSSASSARRSGCPAPTGTGATDVAAGSDGG